MRLKFSFWSSGSHDLGSEYPAQPRASKKLCRNLVAVTLSYPNLAFAEDAPFMLKVHPPQRLSWDTNKKVPSHGGAHSWTHSRTESRPFHSDLLDPMSWVPNILLSLELRKNCANLTMSRRPSFAVAWQSPCAQHTCRHINHPHQNWPCTDHWPTRWWDFAWRPLWGPHPLDIWSRYTSIASSLAQCAGKWIRQVSTTTTTNPPPCTCARDAVVGFSSFSAAA